MPSEYFRIDGAAHIYGLLLKAGACGKSELLCLKFCPYDTLYDFVYGNIVRRTSWIILHPPIQPRLQNLFLEIKEWIQVVLNHTCRPVSNLVPYQHFLWATANLHSVDPIPSGTKASKKVFSRDATAVKASRIFIEKFLSRIIPDMLLGHLRRFWTLPSSAK